MDRRTFDDRMLQHLPAAQRFAVRLTGGDVTLAEDLLHDSIVRATRAWTTYRGEARFTTWWFQIIVNAWRDRLSAREREQGHVTKTAHEAEHVDARGDGDPQLHAESEELGRLVAAQVDALPPRQREVLLLIAYEGMSASEAATVLGVSVGSVRTNLSFARERLRCLLRKFLVAGDERPAKDGQR